LTRLSLVLVSGLALSSLAAFGCGGSSPAQPPTAVKPTPTPEPTPPPQPLSVVPPCALAASSPASFTCEEPASQLQKDVYVAIDRVITERPDLFDLNDVNGGPRILNVEKYMTAVVAALGQGGLCGHIDPEGEIGVKLTNGFSEQWIIASRVGWNPPSNNWVMRKYVGACWPATF
jgi:hypothetical protein